MPGTECKAVCCCCWSLIPIVPALVLVQGLLQSFLLSPPVPALFVVLADLQGSPQPLALLDLGVCELVDLVHLEALPGRLGPSSPAVVVALLLREEFLSEVLAAILDFVLVDTFWVKQINVIQIVPSLYISRELMTL